MRVLTAIRKDIVSKIIVENRTDLVSYPYCMVNDIREPYPQGEKFKRTRVVNLYDNKIGSGQLWKNSDTTFRQVIENTSWQPIMRRRVLIIGDINAHSTI